MEEELMTIDKRNIGHFIVGEENGEGFIKVKRQDAYNFELPTIYLDDEYKICDRYDRRKKYEISIRSYSQLEVRERPIGIFLDGSYMKQIIIFLKGDRDRKIRGKKYTFDKNLVEPIMSALRIAGALVNEDEKEKETDGKTEITKKFHIKQNLNPSKKDIEEMISKVNINLCKQLIKDRMFEDGQSADTIEEKLTDDVVKSYLVRWAKAKYHWYILFGKKLRFEEQIEVEKNDNWYDGKLRDIYDQFPIYKYAIQYVNINEVKNNKMEYYPKEWENDKRITKGMKFTKFVALFGNNDLDMEVSKLYQDKGICKIVISIEPNDYLTASVNRSGWRSCHNFFDGEWRQAPLAYMLDGSSAVSYVYDKEVDYNYKWKFKTNSKKWRQMIYWDGTTSTTVFSRQYPYVSDYYANKIREMFETKFSEEFDAENKWKKFSDSERANVKVKKAGYVYNDVENGFNHTVIKNSFDADNTYLQTIDIGVKEYKKFITDEIVEDNDDDNVW